MNKIFLVTAAIGGVGASLTAMALIDLLEQSGRKVLLIDGDPAVPNVLLTYKHIKSKALDLHSANGLIEVKNEAERHPNHTLVIAAGPYANDGMHRLTTTLLDALPGSERELITLWVIDTNPLSFEGARAFREAMPGIKLHIVMSGYFGTQEKFDLFRSSQLKQEIEAAGGKSLWLPRLADSPAQAILTEQITFAEGAETMTAEDCTALVRWREEAAARFAGLL